MTIRRMTQQPIHGDNHCGYARGICSENRRLRLHKLLCKALANSFSHVNTFNVSIHTSDSIPLTQQVVLTIPIDHSIVPAVSCTELY
jgi:hypothetical protein